MPIIYNQEQKRWLAEDLSNIEKESLIEIGKSIIISGLAGDFTNDIYKKYLTNVPKELCFNV